MGKLLVSWRGKDDVKKIFRAFQYFETGDLSLSYPAAKLIEDMASVRNAINFSQAIAVPFSKVESIKIYQNHRLDIKFPNKETREAFIEKFNLGRLIEEQKNLK